ncbi:MAG: TonB-dependent receptor plug domain-containing protein, partial [Pseudomonadota bacterium]
MQDSHTDKGLFKRTPVASGVVLALASPALFAQDGNLVIDEVVVTAQKRAENLQDVPISIQTLGSQAIEELNLNNFKEYTQMLPSVAMTPTLGAGSSFNLVYMRGIATAGDGQATTSLPSVGMYLDELSITTIQGNLDVHMYDIARVEALAGPQGTLYGASSQAGTLRVITNKPDPSGFSSSVTAGAHTVDDGGTGYSIEGYVNIPISDNAAVRLVGWSRSDAGWVDNVLGSRTFPGVAADPSDDVILTNTDKAEEDYNTLDTIGARAALAIDLNDNWTIAPTIIHQQSESRGSWADDLSDILQSGDNDVTHFKDEYYDDEWTMVGLTIDGSLGNFDIVYSGSYLERDVEGSADYSDYSYWYDIYGTTGYYADLHFAEGSGADRALPNQFVPAYFADNEVGARRMSGARFTNDDGYTKENHEIRISTDPEKRVRGLIGYFWQHQFHDFEQHWIVDGGLAPVMEMNGGTDPRFDDTV